MFNLDLKALAEGAVATAKKADDLIQELEPVAQMMGVPGAAMLGAAVHSLTGLAAGAIDKVKQHDAVTHAATIAEAEALLDQIHAKTAAIMEQVRTA